MAFRNNLETYNTLLKQFHLRDHQVTSLNRYASEAFLVLLYDCAAFARSTRVPARAHGGGCFLSVVAPTRSLRLFQLSVLLLLALPGFLLGLPGAIAASTISERKARQAVAGRLRRAGLPTSAAPACV